jgi:uncharacterized repeat protein (TIGR01451 family)
VDNDTPAPGDTIQYTLTITNGGELNTNSAIITDTLPTGLAFVSGSLTRDGTPQADPTLPTLANGVRVTIDTPTTLTYQMEVGNMAAGTVLTNTAEVSSDEITTPLSASVPITIAAAPAIGVSKTASAASVEIGAPITYTYRITNTGNLNLTAVSAVDDMLGTIDVSSTLAMGEWFTTTEVYTPTVDDLPGPITNTITVTGTWAYDGDTDEVRDTASATVALSSSSGNQAPVAEDDTASTTQGMPVTIAVLNNDSDPDGDTLTVVAVGNLANGTAAISGTSTIVYTPTAAFTGTSPFTYTISDGVLTDSATVTVTVAPNTTPPDAPVITSPATTDNPTPTISGTADAGVTITLTIDLGGGASVTYETTADEQGNWSIDLATATPVSGTFPTDGLAPGAYPVTVTATDEAGNVSAPAQMTLTVQTRRAAAGTTLYLPLVTR